MTPETLAAWSGMTVDRGSHDFNTSIAASATVAQSMTFTETFSDPPLVQAWFTGAQSVILLFPNMVTETGFSLRARNTSTVAVTPGVAKWVAIGRG